MELQKLDEKSFKRYVVDCFFFLWIRDMLYCSLYKLQSLIQIFLSCYFVHRFIIHSSSAMLIFFGITSLILSWHSLTILCTILLTNHTFAFHNTSFCTLPAYLNITTFLKSLENIFFVKLANLFFIFKCKFYTLYYLETKTMHW